MATSQIEFGEVTGLKNQASFLAKKGIEFWAKHSDKDKPLSNSNIANLRKISKLYSGQSVKNVRGRMIIKFGSAWECLRELCFLPIFIRQMIGHLLALLFVDSHYKPTGIRGIIAMFTTTPNGTFACPILFFVVAMYHRAERNK